MQSYDQIRRLLQGVRARWRALRVLQAVVRAGLSVSIVLAAAMLATRWIGRSPALLAVVGFGLVILVTAALIWAFAPLGRVPDDGQVARYIEERRPELDDRLATAVDAVTSIGTHAAPGLLEPMIADAARRAGDIDPREIVPGSGLQQGWLRACVVALVLGVLAFFSTGPARQAFDAAVLTVFPSRVTLQVAPGNVRIKSGSPLGINARLVGSAARVVAQVEIGEANRLRTVDMTADEDGRFRLRLDSVTSPFKYRVLAGSVTSPTYSVVVAKAPRVTRIDLDYTYPSTSGLKHRTDEDSGDVFAPAGTVVQLRVHADLPVSIAVLVLDNGQRIPLSAETDGTFAGRLTLAADGSYRVALAGADGLISNGDTEYFIRLLESRPPDVRILRPAADRSVTPVEEVEIEAQADDDHGIERLELAYALRDGADQVVPLSIPRGSTRVKASHTLRLEGLKLEPGDVVSYYVRARAVNGGVARSDIYFLEVNPNGQESAVASTPGGTGDHSAVDDLVAAQKQIVVATWKIDRRAASVKGARPEQDIRSLSAGEAALRTRVTSQAVPEQYEMTAAATAMGQAVLSLDELKTADALPHEMDALKHLLKAQVEIRRRDGVNRGPSTPIDKELQRTQQTNYENREPGQKADATHDALEQIRELARRQDELLARERTLTRERESLTEAALKRELEKLTEQQSDLRRRLEDLEQQMDRAGDAGDAAKRLREASEAMREAADDLRRGDPAHASPQSRNALDTLRELEERLQASRPEDRRPAGELESAARQLAEGQRQVAAEVSKLGQSAADKQATQWLATEEEQLAARLRALQERLKQSISSVPAAARTKDKAAQAAAGADRELERQRLSDRMQKSAEDLRTVEQPRGQGRIEAEFAEILDGVADTLAAGGPERDNMSQRVARDLAQVQQLRERLDQMGRELDELNRQDQASGQGAGSKTTAASNLERQRQQYARNLQQARDLTARMKREESGFFDGGAGGPTGEGQGMALSAPGTEAFKEDFAKWEQLRAQATQALDIAKAGLTERLQARNPRGRLAAGADDKPPADYQKQVDTYFKALAAKKKP